MRARNPFRPDVNKVVDINALPIESALVPVTMILGGRSWS